jgi:hypothetical protein
VATISLSSVPPRQVLIIECVRVAQAILQILSVAFMGEAAHGRFGGNVL